MAKITLAGHSFHAIINDWPIALLSSSLVFDLTYYLTKKEKFAHAGHYCLLGGLFSGAVAAATGIAEYKSLEKDKKVKQLVDTHASLNTAMMTLALAAYGLRRKSNPPISGSSVLVSAAVTGLTFLSAWYGDEMVYGEGVRVREKRMLPDAPEFKLPGDESLFRSLRDPIPSSFDVFPC